MVEFGPQELAREFHADSTHIKVHQDRPLTLEEYEATRQTYLDAHPEFRDYQFEPSLSTKPAPTHEEVNKGTYIHDRWKKASKRWKKASLARRKASSLQDTSPEDALPIH